MAPGRFEWNFWEVIFNDGRDISWKTGGSLDLADSKSTLVQAMAWCCQATSHYLNQCWPSSLLPYGDTGSQWVSSQQHNHNSTEQGQVSQRQQIEVQLYLYIHYISYIYDILYIHILYPYKTSMINRQKQTNVDSVFVQGFKTMTGAHFTNSFSIAIQIRWKFRLAPISIVITKWSLQNFTHDTTAMLLWHVQIFGASLWPVTKLHLDEISIKF